MFYTLKAFSISKPIDALMKLFKSVNSSIQLKLTQYNALN